MKNFVKAYFCKIDIIQYRPKIPIFQRCKIEVRIPAEADILDSMNDFVIIVFFGFAIKNYIDSEIPKS